MAREYMEKPTGPEAKIRPDQFFVKRKVAA
jgi:hypothetical protein